MADTPLLTPEELSALADGVNSGKIEVDTGYNLDVDIKKIMETVPIKFE